MALIVRDVADALDHAHRRHIVLRDIKPQNIPLHDGRALVADFGVARAVYEHDANALTEDGQAVGTPEYMSPEQIFGSSQQDARSDVYALGCVVYEMLTGGPPAAGGLIGAVGAVFASRALGSMLYGVKPGDPVTYGVCALVLALAVFAAAVVPAARATQVHPMVALRAE